MTNPTNTTKVLPKLKRILVIGSGGRENALAWALQRSHGIEKVWITPGNGGSSQHVGCNQLPTKENDVQSLLNDCSSNEIDLVVIGPEAPLAEGLSEQLRQVGLTVFGPCSKGAQLESSKDWAKKLMKEAGIPTAKHWVATTEVEALSTLEQMQCPLVVKADGLAAGKGVTVANSIEETKQAIQEVFQGKFGNAGEKIILEERLEGPEVSVFALCDGKRMIVLPPAQDHKRLKEGDKGPNTGGMGAYTPAPLINENTLNEIKKSILEPTLSALQEKNIAYRGVMYAGLMLTNSGPKVIEFNCRFGDPECQALMPLMGPELAQVLQACALGRLNQAQSLSIKKSCSACVVAATSGYPEAPRYGDLIKIEAHSDPSLQLFHAGTKWDENGNLITSGGRVISVVAIGETFDNAFTNAYNGMKKINFRGITYRHDIGNQVRNGW